MNNKDLALKLVHAETEKEVIDVLSGQGLWDDVSRWAPYGQNENNYSIIGNQQSSADSALVEKLINSVDAILMKECLRRHIDPTSNEAPKTISNALETFFGINNGQIKTMSTAKRNVLSNNIILAATGKQHGEENLIVVDRGEGQSPNSMPKTILSLSKSNKLKVPFVQGKFNMGGSGALPFCGNHNLELIISKRCPEIADETDDSSDKWSVTIVRKEEAREGRKSSMYTYLTDSEGKILSFEADSLPIIPDSADKSYQSMEFGTYIKLFNYSMTGYKTNIILDYNYRLSLLIPDLAHPIRVRECRKGFSGHTLAATLSGMTTRLYNDRAGNIEKDYPSSIIFSADEQEFKCSIYLFNKDKHKNYRGKHEGVLFAVNGQTQGIISDAFFNRMNLSYLKESLLVIVDCSNIDISHQEDLFMTSRDRLRNSGFAKEVEKTLEECLRKHHGLKEAEHRRREEAIRDKLSDDKPLKDVLQNILKKSTVLSKLFLAGKAILSPIGTIPNTGRNQNFLGKKHPTYFKLIGKVKKGTLNKKVPINHAFRVQFETDVQNDYFSRPDYPGNFVIKMDGIPRVDLIQSLNLYNGIATLTVKLPVDANVGDTHIFETEIVDECVIDNMLNSFGITVEAAQDNSPGGATGERKKSKNAGNNGKSSSDGYAMPEIITVYKDDWDKYSMDGYSALKYVPTDEGGDYYLNMDNTYLLTEISGYRDKTKSELTKARYTYSMALIAMSVIGYYKNSNKEENIDVGEQVARITTMLAAILIPMLESMADLNITKELVA